MQVISHLTFRMFYFRLVYNLADNSNDIIYVISYIFHNYYLIHKTQINYYKELLFLFILIVIIFIMVSVI